MSVPTTRKMINDLMAKEAEEAASGKLYDNIVSLVLEEVPIDKPSKAMLKLLDNYKSSNVDSVVDDAMEHRIALTFKYLIVLLKEQTNA
jgi:hypothetical protein